MKPGTRAALASLPLAASLLLGAAQPAAADQCPDGGDHRVRVGTTSMGSSAFAFTCDHCGQACVMPLEILKTIQLADVVEDSRGQAR